MIFSTHTYAYIHTNNRPSFLPQLRTELDVLEQFLQVESEQNTNAQVLTTFDNLFNITAAHKSDSDIRVPYGTECTVADKHSLQTIRNSSNETERINAVRRRKTGLIAWFVSNCQTASRREDYVRKLQQYVPVDVYGHRGIKTCPKHTCRHSMCELMLNSNYKFYISFENSLCEDYVTEKFFRIRSLNIVAIARLQYEVTWTTVSTPLPGPTLKCETFRRSRVSRTMYLKVLDARPDLYAEYLLGKRVQLIYRGPDEAFICRICKY